jgi:hypothetical protein
MTKQAAQSINSAATRRAKDARRSGFAPMAANVTGLKHFGY